MFEGLMNMFASRSYKYLAFTAADSISSMSIHVTITVSLVLKIYSCCFLNTVSVCLESGWIYLRALSWIIFTHIKERNCSWDAQPVPSHPQVRTCKESSSLHFILVWTLCQHVITQQCYSCWGVCQLRAEISEPVWTLQGSASTAGPALAGWLTQDWGMSAIIANKAAPESHVQAWTHTLTLSPPLTHTTCA